MIEILSEQRASTKENVERKQARTDGEREEEEEEVVEVPEDEDEDDDVPYNPKNLPLGWDGKVKHIFIFLFFILNGMLILFDFSAHSLLVIQTARFEYQL